MKTYLKNLITEKGVALDDEITALNDEGHFGLTWADLIDFIATMPKFHGQIRNTLFKIDYNNGDVFDYLNHLARGMIAATYA